MLWQRRTERYAEGRSGSPTDKLRAWFDKGSEEGPQASPWFTEYQGRELEFVGDVLGQRHPRSGAVTLWEMQRYSIEALFRYHFLAARGPRKVGKSHLIGSGVAAFFWTAPSRVLLLSPGLEHNRDVAWSSLHRTISDSKTPLQGEINKTSVRIGADHYIVAATARNEGRTRGYHSGMFMPADPDAEAMTAADLIEQEMSETIRLLVVMDEAQNPEMEAAHKALDGLTSGENVYVWKFGNTYPIGMDDDHGFLRAHRKGSRYHRIHISWREEDRGADDLEADAFFVPPGHMRSKSVEWLDQMAKDYGTDSALYLSDVCGRFSEGTHEDLCVTRSMLVGALVKDPDSQAGPRMGVDLGFTSDPCVASLFFNGRKVSSYSWLPSADDHEAQESIASQIIILAREWGEALHEKYPDDWPFSSIPGPRISVDNSGLVGVCDILAKKGVYVDRVDFGSSPEGHHIGLTGETKFLNTRAEMYWCARRLLQEGKAQIPEKWSNSWQQAQWTKFERVFKGNDVVIKMEPKDDVKKRHGRSPDDWDADVLALRETRLGGSIVGGGRRGKRANLGKKRANLRSRLRR